MITVSVDSQNERRVVLVGVVEGYPQLTQRWTINAAALVSNPGLLAQARDELIAKLQTNYDNWMGVQAALNEMQQ